MDPASGGLLLSSMPISWYETARATLADFPTYRALSSGRQPLRPWRGGSHRLQQAGRWFLQGCAITTSTGLELTLAWAAALLMHLPHQRCLATHMRVRHPVCSILRIRIANCNQLDLNEQSQIPRALAGSWRRLSHPIRAAPLPGGRRTGRIRWVEWRPPDRSEALGSCARQALEAFRCDRRRPGRFSVAPFDSGGPTGGNTRRHPRITSAPYVVQGDQQAHQWRIVLPLRRRWMLIISHQMPVRCEPAHGQSWRRLIGKVATRRQVEEGPDPGIWETDFGNSGIEAQSNSLMVPGDVGPPPGDSPVSRARRRQVRSKNERLRPLPDLFG